MSFYIYLLVMAGVTYLVRMLPLVLVRGRIKNAFLLSFLHYIPYAVLTAMTVPAMLYATDSRLSAAAGTLTAILLALRGRTLVQTAAGSCGVALAVELLQRLV